MDPKVNGQLQHDWSWLVAVYLFLGGVGGGAYTIAAINSFMGDGLGLSTTIGVWISFPALLIGSMFLIADLGSPFRAVLAGMKPGTSWIARGTWIISIFMVLSFLHLVLLQFTDVAASAGGKTMIDIISLVGAVFAIGTMAYTGILLGASKGIPFWRSGVVPLVFVVSATVTGHFAIMLGIALFGGNGATAALFKPMAVEGIGLVVLEILAILFFLQAAFRQPDPRESAERILRKRMFVIGYFILGLFAPVIIMAIVYGAGSGAGVTGIITVGAILGLLGGLILRQSVLICGALPTLNIAGFQFRRIHRPKEPKPDIGLMPPQ
ncbi:MAG: polysulfide reductase NrfD [candidate division Zixibacteria bacterium]|nr:polysulfide reductase NrfD [candidate division Zixibacteria bacterium]